MSLRPLAACAMLLLSGCGQGGLPEIPDTIPGCDVQDRGVLNLWLMGHGLPPETDGIPVAGGDWPLYFDPDIPLFSFQYPPDWTAYNLDDGVFAGFLIASPDELSQMKFGSVLSVGGGLESPDVVDIEYEGLFGDLVGTERCTSRIDTVDAVGIDSSVVVIEVEEVGAMWVIAGAVYYDPDGRFGFGPGVAMNAAIRWFAAPVHEFADRTDEVFLPVLFQFFYGGSDDLEDRDGDGVPDLYDAYPDDPDRA